MTTSAETPVNPVPDEPLSQAEQWERYITPFAAAIGKSVEEVTVALKVIVGDPGDEAISLLKSPEFTAYDEIAKAIGDGVPTAILKKAIAGLRVVSTMVPAMGTARLNVLPVVPDDESWLAALKIGGVLKFNKGTVIGTVSAALANKSGLYALPKLLVDAMEKHAETLEEPVQEDFYRMQRSLTERSYAEIFAAIPGATGRFATKEKKAELLRKIDDNLWVALMSFQSQLSAWLDSWQKGMSNPAMVMGALASLAGGGSMMPPGMMDPPSTDPLRDAAEGVIASINKIFAGTGIPVAMALAYDAQQIRAALENPALPAQVGAANREQMLRQLGVAVTSDYPRLEQNLKGYTLGIVELPNVTAGETELMYVMALYQLGAMIPWDKLGTINRSGIGRQTL